MEIVSDYLNDCHNFKQFIRKVKLDPSFKELSSNSLSVQSVPSLRRTEDVRFYILNL